MRAAVVLLVLALAGCGRSAPSARVDIDVRNTRSDAVEVRPWPGGPLVSVAPGATVAVGGEAPPEPWTVELTAGDRTSKHRVHLNGAHAVVVTDSGVAPETARDGSDIDPDRDPHGS